MRWTSPAIGVPLCDVAALDGYFKRAVDRTGERRQVLCAHGKAALPWPQIVATLGTIPDAQVDDGPVVEGLQRDANRLALVFLPLGDNHGGAQEL